MEYLREIGIDHFPRSLVDQPSAEEQALRALLKKALDRGSIELARFVRRTCWDQLNIGIYADIKQFWRQSFYDASLIMACLMIDGEYACAAIYRIIDEGLLMGAGDSFDTLHFICLKLKEKETPQTGLLSIGREVFKADKITEETNIDVITPPSLLEWVNIRKRGEPVVIKGACEDWPAMEKWDFDYFRQLMSRRTVPIEVGERYTDKDWGQELKTFGQFLDDIQRGTEKTNYLAQHPLLEQIPELQDDIIVSDYCFIGNETEIDDAEVNAWIGPSGTISSLHTDNKHNLFVQIRGYKLFKLIHPKFNVEPITGTMYNSSRLDPETYRGDIEIRTAVLGPGDMMYIPKLYWHYVRSLSASISISQWF